MSSAPGELCRSSLKKIIQSPIHLPLVLPPVSPALWKTEKASSCSQNQSQQYLLEVLSLKQEPQQLQHQIPQQLLQSSQHQHPQPHPPSQATFLLTVERSTQPPWAWVTSTLCLLCTSTATA